MSRVEQKPPIPGLDSLRTSVEAEGSGTQGGNGRRGAPSSRPPLCRRCLGRGLRLYLGAAGGAGAVRERASPSLCVPGVSAPGHYQPWLELGGAGWSFSTFPSSPPKAPRPRAACCAPSGLFRGPHPAPSSASGTLHPALLSTPLASSFSKTGGATRRPSHDLLPG